MDDASARPDGQEERERQDAERLQDHEERRARLSGESETETPEGEVLDPGGENPAA